MSDINQKNEVYTVLSQVYIADKVEQKGGYDYLSWAHAWDMLKRYYPNAQRKVYESEETGLCYFTDGKSAYVKVGISIAGQDNIRLEHIDYLAIMDYRNDSIPLENITTFEVVATIQRSTAKAIAMHGLGLSLWTGEDVKAEKKAVPEKTQKIYTLDIGDDNWDKVLMYVSENKEMGLSKIVNQLKRKYTIKTEVKKEIGDIIKTK